MIPRSLRVRSMVAAAVAVLLALVVVGVVVDVLVARDLERSLDRTLRDRALEVAQLTARAPSLLTSRGTLDAPRGGQRLEIEVVDGHGRTVARSVSLGDRVLPVGSLVRRVVAQRVPAYADAELGPDDLRVYVAPIASGGAVIVAASTNDVSSTITTVHLFVLFGAIGGAGLAALALALLTGRALSPLKRLARAAAEIERTGDPSRRLPEPTSGDELVGLARTLNAMLASLERARESERRFLADASHELRTPLTALVGNVEYVARHGASKELVDELVADAQRLARLADELLLLSREEATAPVHELVRLDEVACAARENGSVDVIAPEAVTVSGDRHALERAFANLLENAQRYGRPGGRITVEVRANGASATLSVTDEGPGVAPDDAAHVFERFWRGSADVGGSGLGLAIVRATAERHGGRAYASGSRFTIELPLLRD